LFLSVLSSWSSLGLIDFEEKEGMENRRRPSIQTSYLSGNRDMNRRVEVERKARQESKDLMA
jgi:hypothetical protein